MRPIAVLAALAALAGCAPSINPQMQTATDEQLAALKGSMVEAAPSSWDPRPWAVGQWAAWRVTDAEGRPALQRVSIVGAEAGGLWVETERQDYFHHTLTRVLYSRMPRTAEEAVDAMRKVVTRTDGGEPQTTDFTAEGPGVAFAKGLMKSVAQGVVAPQGAEGAPREDVKVPAGTFKGAARLTSRLQLAGRAFEATTWYHPAVPIHGTVKAAAEDGSATFELLDYGLTGAKSRP